MAVFTVVDPQMFAERVSARHGFARVRDLTPVAEGIENSNYRFHADGADYIFTVFELWDAAAVRYYAALMRHFADAGAPVPAAAGGGGGGEAVGDWQGKPYLIVPFVPGDWRRAPDADECGKMGAAAAALHMAAADFAPVRANPRGDAWRRQTAGKIRPMLNGEQQAMLDDALRRDAEFARAPLPAAACHCDLFRNNVLWQGDAIAGVIDFYFGGEDALLFDLAVCACDWCFRGDDFSPALLRALVGGYNGARALTGLEKALFAEALAAAALRFWLSRCYDIRFPRRAERLTPHDPGRFEKILRAARRLKNEHWLAGAA